MNLAHFGHSMGTFKDYFIVPQTHMFLFFLFFKISTEPTIPLQVKPCRALFAGFLCCFFYKFEDKYLDKYLVTEAVIKTASFVKSDAFLYSIRYSRHPGIAS